MASHRLRLWTAAALAVALQTGLGCQARHPSAIGESANIRIASTSQQPTGRSSIRHRHPEVRIFRGSVSSAPHQDDLIAR